MANFKKKNGHRKRDRLQFRNRKIDSAHGGGSWRIDSLWRRFIKAAKAVDED